MGSPIRARHRNPDCLPFICRHVARYPFVLQAGTASSRALPVSSARQASGQTRPAYHRPSNAQSAPLVSGGCHSLYRACREQPSRGARLQCAPTLFCTPPLLFTSVCLKVIGAAPARRCRARAASSMKFLEPATRAPAVFVHLIPAQPALPATLASVVRRPHSNPCKFSDTNVAAVARRYHGRPVIRASQFAMRGSIMTRKMECDACHACWARSVWMRA